MTRGRPPSVLTGRWATLAEAHGGVVDLAKKLGVSTQTVWRWATGRQAVPKLAAIAITAIAQAKNLPSPTRPTAGHVKGGGR
jgi:DNA-binding transcriptional regulator YdaS (Cro superfamily)